MAKKIHVCLCSDCISNLKEFNPWVDKDGKSLSLDEIETEEVLKENCYNYTDNDGNFVNEQIASWYL